MPEHVIDPIPLISVGRYVSPLNVPAFAGTRTLSPAATEIGPLARLGNSPLPRSTAPRNGAPRMRPRVLDGSQTCVRNRSDVLVMFCEVQRAADQFDFRAGQQLDCRLRREPRGPTLEKIA